MSGDARDSGSRGARETIGGADPDAARGVVAGAARTGSLEQFTRELLEHGHRFAVEARGGLAILTSPDTRALEAIDPSLRAWLVDAARRAGFTHVAVEIPDDPIATPREALPGHQSA